MMAIAKHTGVLLSASVTVFLLGAGCGKKPSGAPATTVPEPAAATAEAVKVQTTCPVMGGAINKTIYADHDGKRVYFCCAACIDTFKADPEKYIKKLEDQGVVLKKAPAAQVWTCPMHPDVRQDTPGKCPTCKMDLVPAKDAGAGSEHHEDGMHRGE
jgi:YHS domain-containing protein